MSTRVDNREQLLALLDRLNEEGIDDRAAILSLTSPYPVVWFAFSTDPDGEWRVILGSYEDCVEDDGDNGWLRTMPVCEALSGGAGPFEVMHKTLPGGAA